MVERIRWIEYKGKKILYFDFSGLTGDQLRVKIIEPSGSYYKNLDEHSLLSLANVTGAYVNIDFMNRAKVILAERSKYNKKSAVVGITGVKKVLIKAITRSSGHTFKLFDAEEEAKEWLVTED